VPRALQTVPTGTQCLRPDDAVSLLNAAQLELDELIHMGAG
jgi:hypothetical protein